MSDACSLDPLSEREQVAFESADKGDLDRTSLEQLAPAPMVERAFDLLDLLLVSEQGLSLSDLSRALTMSKSSMHRLLKTLEHCGVVALREERFYVPGPRIYKLAATARGIGLRRQALPAMQRLAASLGETVFLARPEAESIQVIESVEAGSGHFFPHVSVPRGTRMPLAAGAVARLVFAHWSVERRAHWLQTYPLHRFTERSLTDPELFLAAIRKTAETGLGVDREEYISGVNAVAAPIRNREGMLVAALCMLGFASHFTDEVIERAGQELRAEAEKIARLLEPNPLSLREDI